MGNYTDGESCCVFAAKLSILSKDNSRVVKIEATMTKTKTGVYLTDSNVAFVAAHAHGHPTALINAALDFYREYLPDKDILAVALALYREQRGRRDALVEAVERIARAIESAPQRGNDERPDNSHS
jgi:hypothetical protein